MKYIEIETDIPNVTTDNGEIIDVVAVPALLCVPDDPEMVRQLAARVKALEKLPRCSLLDLTTTIH